MPYVWRSRSHPRRHASLAVQRAAEDPFGSPVRSTLLGVEERAAGRRCARDRGRSGRGAAATCPHYPLPMDARARSRAGETVAARPVRASGATPVALLVSTAKESSAQIASVCQERRLPWALMT